jgi:DNA-binding transcriptional regulator YbjK
MSGMPSTSGPVRVRRAPEDRRSEIAAAARAIALDDGLAAVTQRSVAQRAAVAPALVAHYVAGMDALVADTFAAIVGEELREVRALAAEEPDATSRLAAVLGTLLDGSRQDVTLVWVQAWALGRGNEPLAARVREQMDDWRAAIQEVLEEGIRSGAFRLEDAGGTAWHVLAMVDGLNAHALVRWGAPALQARLLRRAVEAMLGLPDGALQPRRRL